MKKLSVYVWAFIFLLLTCFTAGAFCLGTTKNTGKALACTQNKTAYYTVDMGESKMLSAVYLNIGAVYLPEGGESQVYVQYSTSTSSTTNWKRVSAPLPVSPENAYNWICFVSGEDLTNIKRLSFSADCNLDLCELVCLDEKGNVISLAVGKNGTQGTDYNDGQVLQSIDAQTNFYKETGARYAYTREESDLLTSVSNVLRGTDKQSGSIYALAKGYNYLTTLFTLPSVAMFGVSPFALRLPSLVALIVGVAFLFLIAKELLKKDEYALLAGGFGLLACASVFPATGAAYAFGAVLCAAYFAVRFFTRGISSKHIVRGGMNILLCGVFSAIALAMETVCIFPVLGVLTLLGLGLVRQRKAFVVSLEKAGETGKDKIRADYGYKTRVSYCFAALSFVAVTFLLILCATVACYPAVLRTYGESTGFATAMRLGVKAGWRNIGAGGRMRILKWFIGAGMPVFARIVCILGAVGFVCATVFIVIAFVKKNKDKNALRARRIYFLLLGAMLASVLSWLVKGGVPLLPAPLFITAYLALVPVATVSALALWGKKR